MMNTESGAVFNDFTESLPSLAALLLLAVYALGYRTMARSSSSRHTRAIAHARRQGALFVAGCSSLAIALAPRLHELSEQLFSVHMVQHELLMTVAAPLLVLSRPLATLLWALPRRWRRAAQAVMHQRAVRRSWTTLCTPAAGWLAYAIVLWTWHAPYLFQFALNNAWGHAAQHVTFLAASAVFWQSLFFDQPNGAGLPCCISLRRPCILAYSAH